MRLSLLRKPWTENFLFFRGASSITVMLRHSLRAFFTFISSFFEGLGLFRLNSLFSLCILGIDVFVHVFQFFCRMAVSELNSGRLQRICFIF